MKSGNDSSVALAFACPPDCGHCCTHLQREPEPGVAAFRAQLRRHGVYHCADAASGGLSLASAEADALREEAAARGMRLRLHPRTYLLETRRRLAVVLDWHMPDASCPFYADYRCTVYERRPLVCRAYPVMLASPLVFAPACPKAPALAAEVRAEKRARRALDDAHARVDADAWRAMERGRFAKGLPAREAAARMRRYRHVPLADYLCAVPERSSTS